MRCKDVMKTDIKCCSAEDPVSVAAVKMRDENIGFVPICDESRKVQGTLTDRDIAVRVVAERLDPDTRCGDVMTKSSIFCRPNDELHRALMKMSTYHVSRILCIDEQGVLVGVISLSDVAQAERSDSDIADTVRGVTRREATYH